MYSDLTTPDHARLDKLEGIIERGLVTFIEVGQTLLEIRTQRLYRATHPTFEAYCRERWGWSKQHAIRQIQAARVAGTLAPTGAIPATGRQARELVPLLDQGPGAVREAWEALQRPLAGEDDWQAMAEARLAGPFTGEDFDPLSGRWLTTKTLHHVGAPAVTSCLHGMADEYRLPALRLAPADELAELLHAALPYAKSETTFETASVSLQDMIALKLTAQRICGLVYGELERREKAQWLNRWQPSQEAVHRQLLQRIEDALAQLERH